MKITHYLSGNQTFRYLTLQKKAVITEVKMQEIK